MYYWWSVDEAVKSRAAVCTNKLSVSTFGEAVASARKDWECLTAREQEARDAFYVCHAPEAEDGGPDWNNVNAMYSFK